jgi:D-lactate dehydrogenase (cytochrome)
MIDRANAREMAAVETFLERLTQRAIAMEGTCTGEHGVGQGKAKYLEAEVGAEGLTIMRAIKAALDPLDILNPGKILPV